VATSQDLVQVYLILLICQVDWLCFTCCCAVVGMIGAASVVVGSKLYMFGG
jgi:hypothetical protein